MEDKCRISLDLIRNTTVACLHPHNILLDTLQNSSPNECLVTVTCLSTDEIQRWLQTTATLSFSKLFYFDCISFISHLFLFCGAAQHKTAANKVSEQLVNTLKRLAAEETDISLGRRWRTKTELKERNIGIKIHQKQNKKYSIVVGCVKLYLLYKAIQS